MTDGTADGPLGQLRAMRSRAVLGGGQKRIEQQHARGKLTARERLALLLDVGSFQEFGALATHNVSEFGLDKQRVPGDGIVTGFGKISGRRVAVFAQDFTVLGGSFSEVQSHKICRIQDLALQSGIPLIGLNDSGGARIQEGVRSLAAYGEVFVRNVMASGVIPQISVIMGPCAGGAVYSPALTDFVIMSEGSFMFLTGPDVIKSITGEDVSAQGLGGADVHTAQSGVAHLATASEADAIEAVKRLLGYLPQNNNEDPPQVVPYDAPDRMDEALNTLIPVAENEPYDIRDAIGMIFDRGSFMELHDAFAPNAVVGFARLDGFSIGVIANQPAYMAGALNIDASDKISRFIRTCDAYNIPLVDLRRLPGLPARHVAGVRRRDPPRREDHLRLLRGVGAQDLDRHPQGDGRRLRRDVQQADAHRSRLRVADRADRRHGCGARGARALPRRREERRGPAGARARADRVLPRAVLQSLPRRRRGPDRRGDRAGRDAAAPGPRARGAPHEGAGEPAEEARADSDMSAPGRYQALIPKRAARRVVQ